ncbi:phosphatidylinositol 3,4,5-trisphosphate 5-phosphatase 2-like [Pristis pectinata]|uniref:phosphatidylinositol 3,4,5-trisphosphate 5-phosphatase 2-like n=1 Tax=Pristis pectinata TaxID=685728 RepID=UPI00223D62D8|nr:phosphatidylinositol 3,4,5-trisphosphate 5-phosphatase 2-like [Pristis pectinata]XP_051877218.1 phosphatidylinositol 3,4,5-trisphosphate 5-phosphatase 2-like [Pristis pectinata]
MATASPTWYHLNISRAKAEELLAKAGMDGSFLVRGSESVVGAYALCLLYLKQVYTYRILQDEEGFLAVQTEKGVPVKKFSCLMDLMLNYQQPYQGLVTPLQYPVERENEKEVIDDLSDGEDEKPALPPRPFSASMTSSSEAGNTLIQQLQERLQEGSLKSDHATLVNDYLKTSLQKDLDAVNSGTTNLLHLNKSLVRFCKDLDREMDLVSYNLEMLVQVFSVNTPSNPPKKEEPVSPSSLSELEVIINKTKNLGNLLSCVEERVVRGLQHMAITQKVELPALFTSSESSGQNSSKPIPIQSFEVKLGKTQKYTLSVDVDGGKLQISKKATGSPEESISYDKILQLVKYQSSPNTLQIVTDKENQKNQTRDFIFENARKREAFCQLLQLMKNIHSQQDEPDMISIFIGSWNMGAAHPPKSISSWLMSKGLGRTRDETTATIPHDIYVIGTQENSLGDKEWVDFLRAGIKEVTEQNFKVIATHSLWSIKIVVLIKPDHENRVSHVNVNNVKTGIANTFGNKGAVGVSFLFNGTSLGFVNCHLTSGSEKVLRRNQNYLDILRSLSIGEKQLSSFDIALRFTHIFWFGDLNYRLDMDIQDVLNYISKKEFEAILTVDQLNLEQEKGKVFLNFNEEEITFPPTYRYERNTRDIYSWQKHKTTGIKINVPSWCDRVLWKSYPETYNQCTSYGCTDDIMTSDHSPVFSTFEIGVTSQFVSKKGPCNSSGQACIEFEIIEAIVKTTCKTKFFIEFHSSCLEEFKKSLDNGTQFCIKHGFLRVEWSAHQLPMLSPILSDIEYLQDQHLLLTIKSTDGYESYGECCIALKSLIGSTPQRFEIGLSHLGDESGSIRVTMRVVVPAERKRTRERLYEWISSERDGSRASKDKAQVSKPIQECTRGNGKKSGHSSTFSEDVSAMFSNSPDDHGTAAAGSKGKGGEEAIQPRLKPNNTADDDPHSNSFNNPAYFVLEGLSYQSGSGGQESPGNPVSKPIPRNKIHPLPPTPMEKPKDFSLRHLNNEGGSSEHEGPYDQSQHMFHKMTEVEMQNNPLYASTEDVWGKPAQVSPAKVSQERFKNAAPARDLAEFKARTVGTRIRPQMAAKSGPQASLINEVRDKINERRPEDQSPSVSHMAKSLSDKDRPSNRGELPVPIRERPVKSPRLPARNKAPEVQPRPTRTDYGHLNVPPPLPVKNRTMEHGTSENRNSSSIISDLLKHLGLEKYESGLIENGWDNLEYWSDITDDDLREAGVTDANHMKILLELKPHNKS